MYTINNKLYVCIFLNGLVWFQTGNLNIKPQTEPWSTVQFTYFKNQDQTMHWDHYGVFFVENVVIDEVIYGIASFTLTAGWAMCITVIWCEGPRFYWNICSWFKPSFSHFSRYKWVTAKETCFFPWKVLWKC